MNNQRQATPILHALSVFSAALFALSLVACGQADATATPRPTSTPTPLPSPSATPTPTLSPTAPLAGQTWQAGPVLLKFGTFYEASAPFGVSSVPRLILYSDGLLVLDAGGTLYERLLTRQETCSLLNSIDQAGFFDIDLSGYAKELDKLPLGLVPSTRIVVNAWQSRAERLEALETMVNDPGVNVPDTLRAVYGLLSDYQPDDLQPYQFTQLAFTIYKYPADTAYQARQEWPLESPSLAQLFEQATVPNRMDGMGLLLEGDAAPQVYAALQDGPDGFTENGATYAVSARPLLPYESLESAASYQARIPSPGVHSAATQWTCYPSDGALEIP